MHLFIIYLFIYYYYFHYYYYLLFLLLLIPLLFVLLLLLNWFVNKYLIILLITILLLLLGCQNNFCIVSFPFYLIYYFVCTLLCLFSLLLFFAYIFYIRYASKARAACLMVPYTNWSKVPIWLLGREGLVQLLVDLGCLDLYLAMWLQLPLICKEKPHCGSIYMELCKHIRL